MVPTRFPCFGLHIAGAISAGIWGGLALASHEAASLAMVLSCVGAAWALLGVAWWCARGVPAASVWRGVWIWAITFRVIGFFGEPLLEDDWARYLWDGRQFALTGNPYAAAPAKSFADQEVPERFQRILDEINHPDLPTVYGPVCQAAFALSYWIAPGQLWPLKLFLLIADLAALALLSRMAAPRNLLIYAWCPLLIHEVAFTAHAEMLWVALLVSALYALRHGSARTVAVCCGLAVGAKVFALVVIPFLLHRVSWRGWLLAAGVAAATYLPFWMQGSIADLAGLLAMATDWEFNSLIYAPLAQWLGAGAAKMLTGAAFAAIWLWLWRSQANAAALPLDRPLLFVLAAFFVLSPVLNPWYLLALLPFLALRPTAWGVAALVVVTLSYAHGLYRGEPSLAPYEVPGWVRSLQIGVILFFVIWQRLRLRTPAERDGD